MAEVVRLESPAWSKVLFAGLNQLWRDGELCDVFINSKDESSVIKSHAIILAAASPFFCDILKDADKHVTLSLVSFSREVIMHILDFVYTGTLVVRSDDLPAIQEAAATLNFPVLESTVKAVIEKQMHREEVTRLELEQSQTKTLTAEVEEFGSRSVPSPSKTTRKFAHGDGTGGLDQLGVPKANDAIHKAPPPSSPQGVRHSTRARKETSAIREYTASVKKANRRSSMGRSPDNTQIHSSGLSQLGSPPKTLAQPDGCAEENITEQPPRVSSVLVKQEPDWQESPCVGNTLADPDAFELNPGDNSVDLEPLDVQQNAPEDVVVETRQPDANIASQSDCPLEASSAVKSKMERPGGVTAQHPEITHKISGVSTGDLESVVERAMIETNGELLKDGQAYLEISDGMGGVQYIQVTTQKNQDTDGEGNVYLELKEVEGEGTSAPPRQTQTGGANADGGNNMMQDMDLLASLAQVIQPATAENQAQGALDPINKPPRRNTTNNPAPKHYGPAFQCDTCGSCFTDETFLEKHRERAHRTHYASMAPRRFRCDFCDYSTEYKALLEDHTRIHTGEKPFPCRYCGKSFRSKSILRNHERRESGVKAYQCTYCDKTFATLDGRGKHMKGVHFKERRFVCSYESCGKTYSTVDLLKRHLHVHAGERKYRCVYCSKAYFTMSQLKNHVHSRHVDDPSKRFTCEVCSKVYRIRESLIMHKRYRHDPKYIAQREIKRIEKNTEKERNKGPKRKIVKSEPDTQPTTRGKPKRAAKTATSAKRSKRGLNADDDNDDERVKPAAAKRRKGSGVNELSTVPGSPEGHLEEGETSSGEDDEDAQSESISWHSDESDFFAAEEDDSQTGEELPKVVKQARKSNRNAK